MSPNEKVIETFYTAFSKLDYTTMNSCYSKEVAFFDPMFALLKDDEVRFMWEMLCKNAQEFSLTFSDITSLDDEYYTCKWEATYRLSTNNKMITNKIKAHMRIIDGKIIEHSDAFSLHQWSKQAFGWVGGLFGWNSFFQRNLRNKARKKLLKYIQSKQ